MGVQTSVLVTWCALLCPQNAADKGKGSGIKLTWSLILAESLVSYENVSTLLDPSKPQFPHH